MRISECWSFFNYVIMWFNFIKFQMIDKIKLDNDIINLMSGTRLTNYSAIPNKVCDMSISSTAKVIYAKLLNRAQLSAGNGFVDGLGRAYVIYTIEDMAKELG